MLDRIWNRFHERLGLVQETISVLTQDLDKFYVQWKFQSELEKEIDPDDFTASDLNFFKSMLGSIKKPCEQMLFKLNQKLTVNNEKLLKMSHINSQLEQGQRQVDGS